MQVVHPRPEQVFIALDLPEESAARALVERLGSSAPAYKIGIAFLTAHGPALVRDLVSAGKTVFLDLKLHEIPASVAAAVTAAGLLGAHAVTVHASAGSAVLRAAVAAARPFPALRVLALTVITSLDNSDLPELGLAADVAQQVERLARLAAQAGCHGVIASAWEAARLRPLLPESAWIVTPGVQPGSGVASPDQHRVATAEAALAAGATHLIVGRAITTAPDPVQAWQSMLRKTAS
ncbi:MAG: orotidine-5'-phosphate decarboxylase [Methylibium sp.]|nr:orotidine-5'-phosphate decarboxylase [Methylibium sp.]